MASVEKKITGAAEQVAAVDVNVTDATTASKVVRSDHNSEIIKELNLMKALDRHRDLERFHRGMGVLVTALVGRVILPRLPAVPGRLARFFAPSVLSTGVISLTISPCTDSSLEEVRSRVERLRSRLTDRSKISHLYLIGAAEGIGVALGKVGRALVPIQL